MTRDPNIDPVHALDAVDPPEQWDDITARAAAAGETAPAPAALAARRTGFRRPALLAAAVLAVVAVAGGLVVVLGGGDGTDEVVTGEAGDEPAAIWGHTWSVRRLVHDGNERELWPSVAGGSVRLDATEEGRIEFQGCNRTGGSLSVEGDRLAATGDWTGELRGCTGHGDESGDALMAQDRWLWDLFEGGFTVAVDGRTLTLTDGDDRVEAVRLDPPADVWGREWQVDRLVVDGALRAPIPAHDGTPLRLDATGEGTLAFNGCNGAGGAATVDDHGTVTPDGDWFHTAMGCLGPDGEDSSLMDQDALLDGLLASSVIEVSGDNLVIWGETDRVELTEVGPDGTAGGPTTSTPSASTPAAAPEPAMPPSEPSDPGSVEADTAWDGAILSADGRTLTVTVGGRPDGTGPCEQRFRYAVTQDESSVTVAFDQVAPEPTDDDVPVACEDVLTPQVFPVMLDEPLGDRDVYDGVRDTPRTVGRLADLVQVTGLGDEWVATATPTDGEPGRWQQTFEREGADWYLAVSQYPSSMTVDLSGTPEPVTVNGVQGMRFRGQMNDTMESIVWTVDGLTIWVWGEMQGPPTFTHSDELLEIAEGVRLPS